MAARSEAPLQAHCPHLGLRADRGSFFSEPTEEHRCYAAARPQSIQLEQQASLCLTGACVTCPRYVPVVMSPPRPAPVQEPPVLQPAPDDDERGRRSGLGGILARATRAQLVLLTLIPLLVVAALFVLLTRSRAASPTAQAAAPLNATLAPVLVAVTPTPAPTRAPAASATAPSSASALIADRPTLPPPPTPTLLPGQIAAAINPAGNSVGWLASADRVNHFGDRNLHAGVFDGQTYKGALQFSLASIPVGAKIHYAAIELVGLNGENTSADGKWALGLLDAAADANWTTITYDRIRDATVSEQIGEALTPADLGTRQMNVFTFSPEQLPKLEERLASRLVSFRIDGPGEGSSNLFTWDTGYGGGFGNRPVLRVIYQPPPTLTPIVITVTPAPANLATAAAQIAQATYQAQEFGTPTPFPTNVVTAPPPFVITNTPTPGNAATAEWVIIEDQARVKLYGTPTPLPEGMIVYTATPIPPTTVPPTRLPPPLPPTITPTPLPLLIPIERLNIPTTTPTPRPTSTPSAIPDVLLGKIAFISDRMGKGKPSVFVMDPDGSNVALLTDPWAYLHARELAEFSPDGSYRVFVRGGHSQRRDTINGQEVISEQGNVEIWAQQQSNGWEWNLTTGLRTTYDPVWSPAGSHVAFVSNESGNDDIYLIDPNTKHETRLTNNGPIWDKHPSYSPDGSQIVFWSNRSGHQALWIMNADGSDQRLLVDSPYNDWDPVWIK